MFTQDSFRNAESVLKAYGGSHFLLMADGQLLVVVGAHNLEVADAPDVQMPQRPSEIAAHEAANAIMIAQAQAAQVPPAESLLDKAKKIIGL